MRAREPQGSGTLRARARVEPWLCAVALSCGGAGAASRVAPGPPTTSEPTPERAAASRPAIPELVLTAALPLAIEDDFQPSALLWHEGQLLTVSDKHDDTIYAIDRGTSAATLRPFVRFEPPLEEPPALDLEGLSAAPDGGWWLASESQLRVLHVQEADAGSGADRLLRGRARWLTPSLRAVGAAKGCFHVPNAGFEGIALSSPERLLLAVEREPRALLELGIGDAASAPDVQLMPATTYPAEPGRQEDFADLTRFGGQLYALVRNAHLVVRLEHDPDGGWREGVAFSFRDAENDPRYRSENRKYGLAEGLAMTEREVFVVLDNNGQAREADESDRRPILFVFERPPSL
jgi:hypothetical protein